MPKGARVSVRLPKETREELARLAFQERRPVSAVIRDFLEEAIRMRRCPGIAFMPGPTGRRAVLAGTGLEVWEVVRAYKACGEDFQKLKEAFDWLSPRQLSEALNYWRLYPEEIEEEIQRQEEILSRGPKLYPHLFPNP